MDTLSNKLSIPTSNVIGIHERPNSPGHLECYEYNNIENAELGVNIYLALVPEDMAQGTKGLRIIADSGVHLNFCATVALHMLIMKVGHLLYRIITTK